MKITGSVYMELTSKDVEDILKDYVKGLGYKCKGGVKFTIEQSKKDEWLGNIEIEPRLTGAIVEAEKL